MRHRVVLLVLFSCALSCHTGSASQEDALPFQKSVEGGVTVGKYSVLPDPHEMVTVVTTGTDKEKKVFQYMYDSMLSQFDVEGYNWLMSEVMKESESNRFLECMSKIDNSMPHCDKSTKGAPGKSTTHTVPFPGGPIRRSFGFDLSKWLTDMLMAVQSSASGTAPGLANMAMQSLLMVKGMIQSVVATILDIVPPMIPPPVWILRPLPCLPMLTGMNCLGSVLYPITISDFVTADVTDSVMNGVLSSFPAKYASKVGKTSETQYRICAAAYLGMYCASIFPICWLPIGLQEVQTFPICFPQCIASLIACPGFWLDDIMGPCSDVSVPPFCSFSLFINQKLIPPQYSTYEQSHPFPQECPKYDPLYDTPDDLFDVVEPLPSPITEAAKEEAPREPYFPPLGKSIADYAGVSPPEHVVPTPCDCNACKLHRGLPVYIKGSTMQAAAKYETPSNQSKADRRCCDACKKAWEGPVPPVLVKKSQPKRVPINLKREITFGSKLGHVIPVPGAQQPPSPKIQA